MLDTDGPADRTPPTDSPPTTRRRSRAAAPEVPAKRIRVSALAKELGLASRELVALLAEIGEGVKTASSALDADQVERVRAARAAAADEIGPAAAEAAAEAAAAIVFVAPEAPAAPTTTRRRRRAASAPAGPPPEPAAEGPDVAVAEDAEDQTAEPEDVKEAAEAQASGAARRRRRRGRRGRGGGKSAEAEADEPGSDDDDTETAEAEAETAEAGTTDAAADQGGEAEAGPSTRRRRRRRRSGGGADGDAADDDPPNTVVHVRAVPDGARDAGRDGARGKAAARDDDDGVKGVKGSTRLEARRQRRRDGRETTRRRVPILTEAEFLARREAVDRVMAVRQAGDRTQIAVLEDNVLVEHHVTRASAVSYVGNVYLGRVQNVLPSMEAAFIDIGKGRNGVLYAGEVNWDAAGLAGKSRAIEQALKSGDAVLVQVTKDPIGHKGARLTSQVTLPGRFLVYVPGGGMTGISRRLPDTERHRLKSILKKIVPEDAGVIVRTAAEGASEAELTRDVDRLRADWATIQKKAAKTSAAPTLVHGEPDLAIRVVRDVFNEDFNKLLVQGEDAWNTVSDYVDGVAPDLAERVSRHTGQSDLFADLRVDEQIMKALDRKVWLPSGGSLVIDRTEAMTVIDVNTGKFVGSGGNLEQTVTRNNLEAAEEIVRQLRLRDVGGIVVIDFIDMVLESNRELVLRRLTECLGRDRTKHQVAEVTSLGLVQMTRKRVGEGLLEAFSETCEVCHGRGVILHGEPVDRSGNGAAAGEDEGESTPRAARTNRRRGKRGADPSEPETPPVSSEQRDLALAAITAIHRAATPDAEENGAGADGSALDESPLAESPVDESPAAEDLAVVPASPAAELAAPVEPVAAEPVAAEPVAAEPVAAEAVAAEPVEPPVTKRRRSRKVLVEVEAVPDPAAGSDGASDGGIAPGGSAADGAAAVAAPADAAVDASPEAPAGAPVEVPAKATRPRRRRAASRPAGPPGS